MAKLSAFLNTFPVATFVHVLAVVVISALYVIHGRLPDDAPAYFAIVEGGNGLLAIGRGLTVRKAR